MLHCFVRNSQRKVVSIGDFHNNIYNKSKLIGIGRFGSSNQVRPKKKITEIPTLFEHPQIPTQTPLLTHKRIVIVTRAVTIR